MVVNILVVPYTPHSGNEIQPWVLKKVGLRGNLTEKPG